MSDGDEIRLLKMKVQQLESALREIQSQIGKQPLRVASGGGGGGFQIRSFDEFPPIPERPTVIDCKNELWYAREGYTVWKPSTSFTDETGEPGT